jgi:hypothetical protein
VRLPAAQFPHFANLWQNPLKFAKHWQNHPPRVESFLPMFGKNWPNLPNIGKSARGAFHPGKEPRALPKGPAFGFIGIKLEPIGDSRHPESRPLQFNPLANC